MTHLAHARLRTYIHQHIITAIRSSPPSLFMDLLNNSDRRLPIMYGVKDTVCQIFGFHEDIIQTRQADWRRDIARVLLFARSNQRAALDRWRTAPC